MKIPIFYWIRDFHLIKCKFQIPLTLRGVMVVAVGIKIGNIALIGMNLLKFPNYFFTLLIILKMFEKKDSSFHFLPTTNCVCVSEGKKKRKKLKASILFYVNFFLFYLKKNIYKMASVILCVCVWVFCVFLIFLYDENMFLIENRRNEFFFWLFYHSKKFRKWNNNKRHSTIAYYFSYDLKFKNLSFLKFDFISLTI